MKKILLLLLALAAIRSASAQQPHSKANMTIIIFEPGGEPKKGFHVIVTRTDSAGLESDVDRSTLRKARRNDQLAVHEALLQSIIQLYLDQGWQIGAAFVESSGGQVAGLSDHTYRYYLSRQK